MNRKIAVLILMLASALFLVWPLRAVLSSLRLKKTGVQTESTVTGVRRVSKKGLPEVSVAFTDAQGKHAEARAVKRNFVQTGDRTRIWYDPANPAKIDFGDTIGYNMRGVIVAGLLFLFGLYYFIRFSSRDRADKRLMSKGRKVAAEFVSVDRNEKYRMGANNPWIIRCRWTDGTTGHEYFFVSRDYTIDPAPYLNGRSHLDVFIDPGDPGRYYIDVSFMPKGNITIG